MQDFLKTLHIRTYLHLGQKQQNHHKQGLIFNRVISNHTDHERQSKTNP